MSQNDFNIANQGFPQFRADLNSALQALASTSAGATAPGTTYAYQLWYDTSTNLLKMRNADNDGFITLASFDQAADEWELRTAVVQAVDSAGVVIKTDDGVARISVADSGAVSIGGNLAVDTDTLFVDAANNRVGINTSSPAEDLDVAGTLRLSNTLNSANFSTIVDGGGLVATSGNNNPMYFYTGGSERMRINASGDVLIGKTSAITNGAGLWLYSDGGNYGRINYGTSITGTSFPAVFYNNSGSTVGTISYTTTTTTYATSSDYRLKGDVQPLVNATDRLMTLKPVNFAWKINGERVDGFLAHEVQAVVPEAVTGEKDAADDEGNPVYQGIDQSKLVPLLTAALQEALTKIEDLEARIVALETQ